MSEYTRVFERICSQCPFKDRCYASGEIDLTSCDIVSKLGGSKSTLAIHMAVQFKAIELYKWNRSMYNGDIGWEKALSEWNKKNKDSDFARAYARTGGFNFIKTYSDMENSVKEEDLRQNFTLVSLN